MMHPHIHCAYAALDSFSLTIALSVRKKARGHGGNPYGGKERNPIPFSLSYPRFPPSIPSGNGDSCKRTNDPWQGIEDYVASGRTLPGIGNRWFAGITRNRAPGHPFCYSVDIDKARAILVELRKAHADVREVVSCLVTPLGDSSLQLTLRLWCDEAP